MTHPLARLVALACRRPWATLALGLLLTVAALLFTADRIAITTDATALISPDVPWRLNERKMDAAFPQNGDSVLVVIDGATPEIAERSAADLAAKMAADPRHFRRVTRPDGGEYFAREGLLFGSQADVDAATKQMIGAQPFLGPLAGDPSLHGIAGALDTMLQGVQRGDATLAQIDRPMAALADALDAEAAGKPAFFSWQALFGSDAGSAKGALAAPKRRLVLATPVLDFGNLMPGEPATDAVRAAARALNLDAAHGVTLRITGSVPLSDEEFASLADHAWLVGAVMVLAMLATLWLAVRSWRIVGAILGTTIAGLIVTSAIGLLAVGEFNLISVAFIPLFVGLGVDFGIQLGVRFQAERLTHDTPIAAMTAAATALGAPLLLAAGAVCLGFLAFLPTAYVGIAELGVIAGLGMIVALVLSVTLLPALLMLLKPGQPRAELGHPALAPVDGFLIRRRRPVLILFGLAMAFGIASLWFVRFDFNPLHLRNPHGEAMATLADLMTDPDRDPNTIDILAPNLPAAQALAVKLSALPEVGQAITAASFVPADQAPKLATIANAQALLDFTLNPFAPAPPTGDAGTIAALGHTAAGLRGAATAAGQGGPAADARRLAAAFDRLAGASPAIRAQATALLVPPLGTMLDQMRSALAAEPVTIDTLPAAVKQDWIARDGQARVQLTAAGTDRSDAALARFVAAVQTIAPGATGTAVSTQAAAHTVAMAFVEAGVLALIAVSLLLFAVLRSAREVAFTLAPVVLSGFLTLGTCVLIGQPINFANIIAFPLLFGVGVAFHIYFVMAWRAGATDLLQSPLARAIFFSALATGSAFGSLWLSRHPGTASMGKILMISLAWTLVCALIFEPALLGPQHKKTTP
ncbi:MMPL family transporter [Sphingomonas abietis]|uniref:MMPL family transporter n=1 Tax=Sphingomonas abietis TaxID=3012344 RepID=A0ABY7NNA1_9SPHN|nr:MMPL family transporter [Sphingomonas abietis]WBO23005.1 MMPL family transporter [Sphingomonas abietis]